MVIPSTSKHLQEEEGPVQEEVPEVAIEWPGARMRDVTFASHSETALALPPEREEGSM